MIETKTSKVCNICKEDLPIENFNSYQHKTRNNKFYYQSGCKKCHNIKSKIYNKVNNKKYPSEWRYCAWCNTSKKSNDDFTLSKKFSKRCDECITTNRKRIDLTIEKNIIDNKIINFIDKIERQQRFLTTMDAFYLVSFGVDVMGYKDYGLEIEDELILTYDKLKEYCKNIKIK